MKGKALHATVRRTQQNHALLRVSAAFLFLGAASASGAAPSAGPPRIRFPLELTDPLTATPVRLESGAQVLHLAFTATWCEPCVEELSHLTDLELRWGERGYRLVLVAVSTRQTAERLRRFVQARKPPGRLLLDASGQVQRMFGIDSIPAHVLVDKEGRLLYTAASLQGGVEATLKAEFEDKSKGLESHP